jgi:flotillin
VANVKIAGEEPLLNNAVERFLTRKSDEVLRIARETLEGNLRGVLATLTPEEVNEDKTRFAENLIDEAEHDMRRMGLVLETLKIQNVSDEVGYLNSIGRIRGASVRQEAAIAEAVAQADAAVKRANTQAAAELARIDAELEIMRAKFLKRTADAQTKRAAVIAEAEGQVGAEVAQLRAELELQRARVVQTQRQLEADVVQPAQAACAAAEQVARGEAARVVEAGRAQAAALGAIVARYQADAHSTRDILVFQKLLPLIGAVAGATRPVSLEKLTVLPRVADGQAPDFSRQAVRTAEELRAATGIDLASIARRLAGGAPGGGT